MNRKDLFSNLPVFGSKPTEGVKSYAKPSKDAEKANKPPFNGIKRVSDKRAKEELEYSRERKAHLKENNRCELRILGVCTHVATTIHHSKGRIGKLLLDKTWWKRGCMPCHKWVEEHPEKAKEMKLSFNRFKT